MPKKVVITCGLKGKGPHNPALDTPSADPSSRSKLEQLRELTDQMMMDFAVAISSDAKFGK